VATVFAPAPQAYSPRKKSRFGRYVVVALLVTATLFYLAPVYVMVINGLKDKSYMTLSGMWNLPLYLNGGGFPVAWDVLSPSLWASLRMVVPATILSSLLGAVNGYLLSKWKFRGSDVIFTLILFGMFIPYQAILIPLIRMLDWVGIYGSWKGLVMVHVIYGIPITSLIFRNYFTNVPSELVEAARIDGAGLIQTFFQIMLPLSLPAFVVVGIFQFTNIWNDFLFGASFTSGANVPMTVALNNLVNTSTGVREYNVHMAAAMIAALPTLLVYVLAGRYFVRGLMAGAVKG
jgi:glucose/mannose transport system permease protein